MSTLFSTQFKYNGTLVHFLNKILILFFKESLKEHLCSIHNCTKDALAKCLALIGDSGNSENKSN